MITEFDYWLWDDMYNYEYDYLDWYSELIIVGRADGLDYTIREYG
jgi:hypothetical protein